MDSITAEQSASSRKPTVWIGVQLYLGYLAIFFATWITTRVDYNRIGENAQNMKLWYAFPTLFGCAFLVAAITILGWWRIVLFDRTKSGPRWIWTLPIAMAGIILINFLGAASKPLTFELLAWSILGALGVGFGEEMITRGSLIVGLRSRLGEGKVWLISSFLFSAMHIPNVLFGFPLWAMPVQVLLTFIMGSGFYALRRMSGTLILPMVLHGLWDSALFLNVAVGREPSSIQYSVYPIAIACVIAVLRWERNAQARHG
ncbi:CPBP family intramembrane glutamic endopeptidase [Synechococcus sp. RedBA-s]|uniref:CPBP family intramembrane glutamic endopeptidase n=1 Tax=Synechococcus sp. RedBA-s TaxID=2823741 RepID=UPI0020CEB645|nr:CPBP family intramembrane glutamic endopeptidase [Synechococcus sp. RedBA-s]MCP9799948.1 CPBP family intramembrane metalloprotease [Synechococcus sp. RedBA-s]